MAWTAFLDASRLLEEVLAQNVARVHGMTHSDYEVLTRLDAASGRLRMTALADEVVSSAQKLTHTANRLEDRGWIRRERVAEDGRGLVAILTESGRTVLNHAARDYADQVKLFLLGGLSDRELTGLTDVLDRAAAHLRQHRIGAACAICEQTVVDNATRRGVSALDGQQPFGSETIVVNDHLENDR